MLALLIVSMSGCGKSIYPDLPADPIEFDMGEYTNEDDTEQNFLMDYITDGVMEQPSFWRAADTKGKDLFVPAYIDSLGYEYWE